MKGRWGGGIFGWPAIQDTRVYLHSGPAAEANLESTGLGLDVRRFALLYLISVLVPAFSIGFSLFSGKISYLPFSGAGRLRVILALALASGGILYIAYLACN